MGNPNLDLQFYSLMKTLKEVLLLVLDIYEKEAKIVVLILLAYFSYQFGKSTVVDPLEEVVKQMKNVIYNRTNFTEVLPKKIRNINLFKNILCFIIFIGIAGYFGLKYLQHQAIRRVDQNILLLIGQILFSIVVILWMYQKWLNYKVTKGSFNDHAINEKLGVISKLLGPKSENLLKFFMCRDLYSRQKTYSANVCNKDKCKDYRLLLKEKSNGIMTLVGNVLDFDWCSGCKKRIPFDQFLNYQARNFNSEKGGDQLAQVNQKNNYLLAELQCMVKWVKELSPCNCSMRYWIQSKKEISEFKKREKEIDQKIALYQSNAKK